MIRKIAIFNDFQLPIPAVRGGAVQQLTTAILDQNELNYQYDIDVFSPYDRLAKEISKKYLHTKFHYSHFSRYIRLYTNICFKLRLPVDLSAIPIPFDILRAFKRGGYDAVFVNGYIRGVLSVSKFNNRRCPIFYQHHVVTDIVNEPTIRGKDIFEVCEKVAFVSQYACDKALTGISEYDEKILLFRNCIDVGKFQNIDRQSSRIRIREKYNISSDDLVLVFIGRFVYDKGVMQLLNAFRLANNNKLKLIIIGGETYSSNSKTLYVKRCIELAKELSDKVILTGYVPNCELPEYLAAADIGCVPSVNEEACGLTALEMMAASLPLITTSAGGLREYVPNECAEISEWHVGMNADEIVPGLVSAINKLSIDEKKRSEMGSIAAKKIWDYDVNKYLDKFGAFFSGATQQSIFVP